MEDIGGHTKQAALITLCIVSTLLAGCTVNIGSSAPAGKPQSPNVQLQEPDAPQEQGVFPDAIINNFMNACLATGGTQEYCGCNLDEIQRRFTVDEYIALEASITSGNPDPAGMAKVTKAQSACL